MSRKIEDENIKREATIYWHSIPSAESDHGHNVLHHDSDVIVHVFRDVSQETGRDDTDTTERDANQIHVLVR